MIDIKIQTNHRKRKYVLFAIAIVVITITGILSVSPVVDYFNSFNIGSKTKEIESLSNGGDISAVVDSWEYDGEEGKYPDMIRINQSDYYAIVSTGNTGTENDGYVRTIHVWDNNGTIEKNLIDYLKFSDDMWGASICHVSGDVYVVGFFNETAAKETLVTVTINDADGSIANSVIETTTLTYSSVRGTRSKILHITGLYYAVLYSASNTNLWLETLSIKDDGDIAGSVTDNQEIDTSDGIFPDMCLVDSDTVAIVYDAGIAGGNDGFMSTWNISSSGDITNTYADFWEFDATKALYPIIEKVDDTTYMVAYEDANGDLYVKTCTIADNGDITKSWIDTQAIDTANGDYPTFFNVSINGTNKWIKGISFAGDASDGYISTFDIDASGNIGHEIDTLEYYDATTIGWYAPVIYMSNDYFLISCVDSLYDGWVKTIEIETLKPNNAPSQSGELPTNGSTNIDVCPSLYVICTDPDADTMTATWWSNSSGTWAQFATNTSISNNTNITQTNTNFSAHETKYYWSVNLTDGTDWNNETYHFTTEIETTKPVSFINETSSYYKNFNWFLIHGNASDDDSGVNATELWYRYSADNSSWGAWTYADNDTTNYEDPAWLFNFNTHGGYGYYEFYSRAYDNNSNYEDAPLVADYICRYVSSPVISSPVPADGSEIDYDDATGLYNVTITDASTTFNWTIEIYYTGAGYFNNSGTDDTTGVKHCFYGFGYNYSYLVYVNVTNSFGLSADETYTFDIEPNCPPSVNWTYPANNSENNSLALIWECTFNDTTPGLPYWLEIAVYNNDTGIIFQNQHVFTINTTANINLFGMNQSTWYRVEVKLYEPGADGCEECIGVDPSMPTSRNATFYFKTVNFTGYTWWDTDWKAKKLIKFDVNESEAEDLQVLINISKGPYGFPDNLATFPPTIYINSSNLGECRFVAQYWNTTDSTWGDTELYCYAELNSKTYDYITLPYEGAPVGADWIHVWVRLPPSNDTDKEYNRTAGEIWVYYKNLDHYPYNPISTTLELDSNGNDTFYWFRGFNEWIDESEWTQYTSGKHVWATLPIPDLNSTDKRLRFYQYMYQYHEAAGVDQYMDLFYVASTTGYNSAEKLSYYIKVDHATDKLYYYATGNHAGAPFTLMSAIMDWDAGGVYGFHDLIWYNDTEILINAYDYNGNFAGDADTSQTLDASLFKYIGFHMYTDVFAYSCQWGWDDTFLPSSLWQHVYDQWGDAEIYTSQLYCSIGKYIGREPTVTTTLLVELPYFILYTPTNGETDVELNPVLTGMVINGMGNALTQWWCYDPSLGWYNWLGQDNITTYSQVISLNTSLINDVYRRMINDGLWGSEYDTVYKWRITVTDGYTTFTEDYEFTTRFAIIANFTYVINGQQVIFTDTSTGAIDNMTTWYWDYGDGTTEDGVRNPVHYFYASANFTVTLIIEQITYHWSSEHNETLMMYVAPTVAPISILWQFDWGMFLPFVYILIILMLFLVLIFTIFRSAGKRYKPPRR